jgi:hypothetical protein
MGALGRIHIDEGDIAAALGLRIDKTFLLQAHDRLAYRRPADAEGLAHILGREALPGKILELDDAALQALICLVLLLVGKLGCFLVLFDLFCRPCHGWNLLSYLSRLAYHAN